MFCDVVNKSLDLIQALEGAGARICFTRVPCHVPFRTTQWSLALDTLWAMLRVALRTLYIVPLVISWICVAIGAAAAVFTMYIPPTAVLTPMRDTVLYITLCQIRL